MALMFLEQFRSGDFELYSELTKRYGGLVRSQFWKHDELRGDVSDLEQELWLLAWTHRLEFRGRPGPELVMERAFKSWLLGLCRTVASRRRRLNQIFIIPVDIMDLPDIVADASAATDPASLDCPDCIEDELWDIVMGLPPRRRLVLLLRMVAHRTTDETATLLGCRPNTVKAALKAAKTQVRQRVERRPGGADI